MKDHLSAVNSGIYLVGCVAWLILLAGISSVQHVYGEDTRAVLGLPWYCSSRADPAGGKSFTGSIKPCISPALENFAAPYSLCHAKSH